MRATNQCDLVDVKPFPMRTPKLVVRTVSATITAQFMVTEKESDEALVERMKEALSYSKGIPDPYIKVKEIKVCK